LNARGAGGGAAKHAEDAVANPPLRWLAGYTCVQAMNIGNLCLKGGDPPLAVPCTPAGCIELLQRSGWTNLSGMNAVVIGRSNIVGMPVGSLLQSMNATVTTCHSRTADIPAHLANADIVVAAIGKAEFVKG
jgi:5,10-methylene-tetrahydrofolate dehydrogenase/methenyl tetrahydrofolate cyclohydrolase